jgi:putative glutamine amidotransferase
MDRGPVVGVVAHGYVVPKSFGALPVTGSPTWYLDGLVAVGARPVLLPGSDAVDLLDVVDAVVLTGGGDVDPLLSGADPAVASEVDRTRDAGEIALVRAAAATGVPLLGVCRGLQVLTVAFGGTLAAAAKHIQPHDGHDVTTAPGSVVHDLVGPRVRTSSLHHQAVANPGPRWQPTAWADDDVIEAVEWIGGGWPALGVQWHPDLAWSEDLDDPTGPALFGWLRDVAAARATSGRSGKTCPPQKVPRMC